MRYQFNVHFHGDQVVKMEQDAVGIFSAEDLLFQHLTDEQRDRLDRFEFIGFKPAIWKPTQAECDLLKKAAAKETGYPMKHLRFTAGKRYNTDHDGMPEDMNWLLVSKLVGEELGQDTDLADDLDWETFRKGVNLSQEGSAVVDLYIRPINEATADKHHYDHLMGNIVVTYEGGKITRISGVRYLGHNWLEELT